MALLLPQDSDTRSAAALTEPRQFKVIFLILAQ